MEKEGGGELEDRKESEELTFNPSSSFLLYKFYKYSKLKYFERGVTSLNKRGRRGRLITLPPPSNFFSSLSFLVSKQTLEIL